MKKVKKILITALSLIIICQLAGAFSVVSVFAEGSGENSGDVSLQEEGAGALEEEAADVTDGENSEEPEEPEVNLLPKIGPAATSTASVPKGGPTVAGASPVYDIVINEIFPNPVGPESGNEWVEIYNKESFAVNISGWWLGDIVDLTRTQVPFGTVIHANSHYLFQGLSYLNNTSDAIKLSNASLSLVDIYSYGSTVEGKSFGRFPDGTTNLYLFSNPTPGAPNYLGQPVAGTVNDGLGSDIDFSNDNTSLSANWSGFSDPIVGLDHYEYAVGTTAGDDDIVSWTIDGLDTSVTIMGLSLSETEYFFSVKTVNKNGVESNVATSDGITIDVTPPEIDDATFNSLDGSPIGPGSEIDITVFLVSPEVGEVGGSFNNKNLAWNMIIDPLIGPIFEATYTVEVGDPSAANSQLQVTVTDRAGNTSLLYIENSGIEIDTTAPDAPLSISVIAGTNNIKINWSASTSPDVVGYNVYRASSPYQKINTSLVAGTSYTDSNVEKGTNYSYKITSVDSVGNETALVDAASSQLVSVTSVSEVVGQILESAARSEGAGFVAVAQAAPKEGEVKGEEAVEVEPEGKPLVEEEDVRNWPMIIAILIAALIIVAGIWYYWVVTRPAREYSVISEPESRRKSKKRYQRRPNRRSRRR